VKYPATTNIRKIIEILKREYPKKKTSLRFNNPLNLLIATILSAQCTDKTVNKVTPYLFKKYKTAGDYAGAGIKTLQREIRPIGLYKTKARNIKKAARKIAADFNGRVPDSIEKLLLLPGVGRKTANIVLTYAFDKAQGIAVDTHVRRLSKRLGLTDNNTPDKIESDLMSIVPKRYWKIFNHLLVAHGRAVCRARNPLHCECAARNYCRWYKNRGNHEETRMHHTSGKIR